jgi:hypothetical protein
MRDQHRRDAHATSVNIGKIRRQMRWCGSMTNRQMLRHSTCRALIGAQHHGVTGDHRSKRHHATARRHTAPHHRRR